MIERGSLNKNGYTRRLLDGISYKCWLIGRLWTENSIVYSHISMKGKIDQMNKVIQYGDERLVINSETGQIVGHVATAEKKQSILTRVLSKCGRIFTA